MLRVILTHRMVRELLPLCHCFHNEITLIMFMLKCECSPKPKGNFDNLDVEEHPLPKSDQKVIFRLSYLR